MADPIDPPVLKEVMRLLSVPEGHDAADFLFSVCKQYQRIRDASAPKSVFSVFEADVRDSGIIFDDSFSIIGKDLADICSGCKKAVLMAVTLGSEVDILIRRSQSADMSEAVILDACASAEAERIADMTENEIMRSLPDDEFLTMRFSPGYGDVSPMESAKIITALGADKKMGLGLTRTGMLIPFKSVTAVIGISYKITDRRKNCSFCSITKDCKYRKKGEFCGIQHK